MSDQIPVNLSQKLLSEYQNNLDIPNHKSKIKRFGKTSAKVEKKVKKDQKNWNNITNVIMNEDRQKSGQASTKQSYIDNKDSTIKKRSIKIASHTNERPKLKLKVIRKHEKQSQQKYISYDAKTGKPIAPKELIGMKVLLAEYTKNARNAYIRPAMYPKKAQAQNDSKRVLNLQ